MPVYWFALSFVDDINLPRAVLIFVILHLLVYPSSNGYNSFMDRDADSIGGLKNPMQPTKQLFFASLIMDVIALSLSLFISTLFATCILIYIICMVCLKSALLLSLRTFKNHCIKYTTTGKKKISKTINGI